MDFANPVNIIRTGDLTQVAQLMALGIDVNADVLVEDNEPSTLLAEAMVRDPEIGQLLIDAGADVNRTDTDGWTLLWLTVLDFNLSTTDLLVRNGADINHRNNQGETPLWAIASSCPGVPHEGLIPKYEAVLRYLCDNGADVNSQSNDGASVLIQAARWDCCNTVEYLIDRGALVNVADEDGWTPLMWAAQRGHIEVAGTLLAYGADLNKSDVKGATALILAAKQNRMEMVDYLLGKGADSKLLDWQGASYQDWLDEVQSEE